MKIDITLNGQDCGTVDEMAADVVEAYKDVLSLNDHDARVGKRLIARHLYRLAVDYPDGHDVNVKIVRTPDSRYQLTVTSLTKETTC